MKPEICSPDLCTGCSACANICVVDAINMVPDERGFIHPSINAAGCIQCHQCVRICPQNSESWTNTEGQIYAALSFDDEIRANSSSGGLFSIIAQFIIRQDGVVYGAAMNGQGRVCHIKAENLSGLSCLCGSKYVQSNIDSCYRQVKQELDEGRKVLFSGTPCQVDALLHFLGRKTADNLYTIDILCHGVPSPLVLSKFLKSKEDKKHQGIKNVNFRKKDPGWTGFSTEIEYFDGEKEIDNSYYYFFVRNYSLRSSCFRCRYSCPERVGDITLGDFWGYRETAPEYIENDDLGISLVSINTEKGQKIFSKIRNKIGYAIRTLEEAAQGNPNLQGPSKQKEDQEGFWDDFPRLNWEELTQKYSISREKKSDQYSCKDREYFAIPYKKRHRKHLIHCMAGDLLKRKKGIK